MKTWRYLLLTVILLTLAAAAMISITSRPREQPMEEDWVGYKEPVVKHIGGKFNVTLYLLARLGEYESGDILYTRDGVERRGYYVSAFDSALNYIKTYTPQEATVLSWWDYGNMIRGLGEREAIAINPSKKILIGVTNATATVETDPDEKIEDIAKVLVATDPKEALTILKKYRAEYVFVPTGVFGDEGKAKWIFYASGISLGEMDSYWVDGKIVGKGMNTILYKMLNKMEVSGFKLVYSDKDTRIYQAVS